MRRDASMKSPRIVNSVPPLYQRHSDSQETCPVNFGTDARLASLVLIFFSQIADV